MNSFFYLTCLVCVVLYAKGQDSSFDGESTWCKLNVDSCVTRMCQHKYHRNCSAEERSTFKTFISIRLQIGTSDGTGTNVNISVSTGDKAVVGSGKVCKSTKQDCPKYHMCRDKQCWPSKLPGLKCSADNDCPNSAVYRCLNKECRIPSAAEIRKIHKGHTDKKEDCWEGRRISCQSTVEDCPKFHMCRLNQCWPTKQKNARCSHNADCTDNYLYKCRDGECVIPGKSDSFSDCIEKDDCPRDHVCFKERCWPSTLKGIRCICKSDCDDHGIYDCIANKCVVIPKWR